LVLPRDLPQDLIREKNIVLVPVVPVVSALAEPELAYCQKSFRSLWVPVLHQLSALN
jgi:hypothetical protein